MGNRLVALACLAVCLSLAGCRAQNDTEQTPLPSPQGVPGVSVSLNYGRVQGMASNQFALWVEDSRDRYVATIYATKYTAQGGYGNRHESIPQWVGKANPGAMDSGLLDSISGATPRAGTLVYSWRYTDDQGHLLDENARYTIRLEASVRWDNYFLWSAVIERGEIIEQRQQRVPSTQQKNRLADDAEEWNMISGVVLVFFDE